MTGKMKTTTALTKTTKAESTITAKRKDLCLRKNQMKNIFL